jgi:Domain of unknown function (DUF5658)
MTKMCGNTWRLLTLPCILLALLLVGSPEFPALDRALAMAFSPAPVAPPAIEAEGEVPQPPAPDRASPPATRRGIIVPLYLSFAALQALDVHSTMAALERGGTRESNPVMAGVVGTPAAFIALKAATGAGIIYLTERVRARSRTTAVIMLTAFNSLYAAVVARNYRLAAR